MEPDINGLEMKSLLNKSLSRFMACTVIILFLATPLFYLLTKQYYAEEIGDIMEALNNGESIPTLDLEEDIMIGLTIQFVLVFAILSLSLLVTMHFITHRLWRPFEDTLKKIEQFNLEQTEMPVFVKTDIEEFTRLNSSISKLMEKDKNCYQNQKEFTENASHELQTPIAIIQSKLDLLLQENLNETQAQIVADLYKVNARMSRLNKNLLLLSKIENAQYSATEPVNLVLFLEKSIPLYNNLQDCPNIYFQKNAPHSIIIANTSLLESLLNNLVVNAIRHSPSDGQIAILTDAHTLTVCNDANGDKLDEHHLFRRFQFSDDRKCSNGMGLSIVKAICDYHKWSITYAFQDHKHFFTVVFS